MSVIQILADHGAKLDVKDKDGRTPMTFAEGIFLAIRPPVAKPEAIALLKKLMANEAASGVSAMTAALVVASVGASVGGGTSVRSGSGGQQPSSDPASRAAGARSVLRHLSQREAEDRRARARQLDLDRIGSDAETWEKVVRKVRAGLMPPAGAQRPDRAALDALRRLPIEGAHRSRRRRESRIRDARRCTA